jgi:sugar phosphate isomerase/epimerase
MYFSRLDSTLFLLEPINRYETDIFNKMEDVAFFLNENKSRLDTKRIGILADTFHMNIEEAIISNSIKKYYDLIKYMHFADSNRLAPGFGHVDFLEIIKVLKENNYKNILTFEFLPYPNSNIAASKAIEYISSL